MVKFKKTVVCVLMVMVWLGMLVVLFPMTNPKGQVATVLSCLTINGILALYYSFIDHRPATFREWLRR